MGFEFSSSDWVAASEDMPARNTGATIVYQGHGEAESFHKWRKCKVSVQRHGCDYRCRGWLFTNS